MNWIKIEDREPKYNQLVLVKGKRTDKSSNITEIGLVYWKYRFKTDYRTKHQVKDDSMLRFAIKYDNITEWCEVE